MKPLPPYITLQAALSFSPEGEGLRRFTMEAYDGGRLQLDGPHGCHGRSQWHPSPRWLTLGLLPKLMLAALFTT